MLNRPDPGFKTLTVATDDFRCPVYSTKLCPSASYSGLTISFAELIRSERGTRHLKDNSEVYFPVKFIQTNHGYLLHCMHKQQDFFGCLAEILGCLGLREAANLEI